MLCLKRAQTITQQGPRDKPLVLSKKLLIVDTQALIHIDTNILRDMHKPTELYTYASQTMHVQESIHTITQMHTDTTHTHTYIVVYRLTVGALRQDIDEQKLFCILSIYCAQQDRKSVG